MLRFMIQKLTHKKWMVVSLLIGNILLIAVAASCPMYKNASLERMLTDSFSDYLDENNADPGMITLRGNMDKKMGVSEYMNIRAFSETVLDELHLTPESENSLIEYEYLVTSTAVPLFERSGEDDDRKLQISSMTDLNNHITLVSGRAANPGVTEDGFIEAVVSTYTYTKNSLMLGDEYEFKYLTDDDGNTIRIRIVGIMQNDDNSDGYWIESTDHYSNVLFIDEATFDEKFIDVEDHKFSIFGYWYARFDYSAVKVSDVHYLSKKLEAVEANYHDLYSTMSATGLETVLENYQNNQKKINVTLLILQVPVLVLLCAFLYMISDQMLQLERNEISLLKSRGASRFQIIMIYLLQSVILSLISLVLGLAVGAILCRAIGSANAFLEFVSRRNLYISIDAEVMEYALIAMLVSICMTVIPVIRYSRVTIVNLKQKKARSGLPFWQKFGLDFIILAVGCYGYYTFSRQKEALLEQVISGNSLDPLLYISSSLFILGAGMVIIRIQPLIIRLLYTIGKRWWKPAAYTSFLQTIRTGAKQQFIMIFLVLTVALGIFNATVARTILSNAERNTSYIAGADLIMKEQWSSNASQLSSMGGGELVYYEPSFAKYQELEGIEALAKVYNISECSDKGHKGVYLDVLGINTKEFGEATELEDGLLKYDYYDYLNVLSTNTDAVLLSENMKEYYKLGDVITITDRSENKMTLTVYGFFSYWPGYSPTTIALNEAGEVSTTQNYMAVTHFSTVEENFGSIPYEIWAKLSDSVKNGSGTGYIYDWAEEEEIVFSKFEDITAKNRAIRNDTLFQGTNGILTMSFIIILVLCVVGFMIYWILSIRQRELLFGVFRAMGMTRREILVMLISEQIFSSLPAILLGTIVGFGSAYLFVPLLQIAYASQNQILPLQIITLPSDMIKMYTVVILMFLICMLVLARQVFGMKISQALKLGED